jgi:hypothetical protein
MLPLLVWLWLWQPATTSAEVSIQVVDARTTAPIAGAQVQIRNTSSEEAQRAAATDAEGRVRFTGVAAGRWSLTVSTIGYGFVRRDLDVPATGTVALVVPLAEGAGGYQEEVTVAAGAARTIEAGVAAQMTLGSAALLDVRGIATDDPLRAVQTLPGVATGDDFQAEFSVRGSAFRHVGLVIDDVPSPMLMHAVRGRDDTGSLSMISADVLDRASLLSGPHPRRHGDWLGASVEFGVREGSRDRPQLRTQISGTNASVVAEGPIGLNKKGAWVASVRKSYVDWLVRKLDPEIESTIGFTDGQAKAVWDLTDRQKVDTLFIIGEAIYREPNAGVTNGLARATSTGMLLSAGWHWTGDSRQVSQRVSWSRSTFRNRGQRDQALGDGDVQALAWRADVRQAWSSRWFSEVGVRYEHMHTDQTLRRFGTTSAGALRQTAIRAVEGTRDMSALWTHTQWRGAKAAVVAGLRLTHDGAAATTAAAPWVNIETATGPVTWRAGVGRTEQALPLEVRLIDPTAVTRERADALDVSADVSLGGGVRLMATPFVRRERDVLRAVSEERIVDGRRVTASVFPLVAPTLTGTSRGVDVLLQRRTPTGLSGWIAYTWNHTRYTDQKTNETFDGDFDQRHTINVFLHQRLSFRSAISAKFRAGSNFPLVGYFDGTLDALRMSTLRNQVRLPWYVRLDLRANRTFTFERKRLTLFVEVVNALGRRNLGQADGFTRSTFEALNFTEKLIPRIPSAGFLIEF